MRKKRPINLALSTITFPPMAIASILHRIAGVIIFLLMPVLLYCLQISLQSQESYLKLHYMLVNTGYKWVLWTLIVSFVYHVVAGVRHLFMDLGYGEQLRTGRNSAITVIALTILVAILLGAWLW